MIIRGRVHPPPNKDADFRGWSFRADEIASVMPRYKGKPVRVDHDPTRVVGKVDRIWCDPACGSLIVDLALNDDAGAWEAMRMVNDGTLTGLSLGYKAVRGAQSERASKPEPTEISIVSVGAMEDTEIFALKIGDMVRASAAKSRSIYQGRGDTQLSKPNMSDPVTTSVTDFASKYTPDVINSMLQYAEKAKEAEREKCDALIKGDILSGWQAAIQNEHIPHDRTFGAFMDGVKKDYPDMVEVLAGVFGNYKKYDDAYKAGKKAPMAAAVHAAGLTTEIERKRPRESHFADLFTFGQPDVVDVQNMAGNNDAPKRVKTNTELFAPGALMADMQMFVRGVNESKE